VRIASVYGQHAGSAFICLGSILVLSVFMFKRSAPCHTCLRTVDICATSALLLCMLALPAFAVGITLMLPGADRRNSGGFVIPGLSSSGGTSIFASRNQSGRYNLSHLLATEQEISSLNLSESIQVSLRGLGVAPCKNLTGLADRCRHNISAEYVLKESYYRTLDLIYRNESQRRVFLHDPSFTGPPGTEPILPLWEVLVVSSAIQRAASYDMKSVCEMENRMACRGFHDGDCPADIVSGPCSRSARYVFSLWMCSMNGQGINDVLTHTLPL
jgi:hypothetical protein